MDGPPEEQVLFHGHPSWRSILGLYLKGWLAAIVAGVLAAAVTDLAVGHIEAGWVVIVVLVVLGVVLVAGYLTRVRTLYTITTERLTIRTGLLSRALQETRLDRIQNVNSRQSLLERLLGVGTIDFDTAAGAEYNFAFHGLAQPAQVVRTVDAALRDRAERTGASPPV